MLRISLLWSEMCVKSCLEDDAQSHPMARSGVSDGAHSDPGRGRALVMLLRCFMCGFMSDKVSSE